MFFRSRPGLLFFLKFIFPLGICATTGIASNLKISSNLSGDTIIALSKWKSNAARVITTDDGKALKDWPAPNTKFGIGQQTCWDIILHKNGLVLVTLMDKPSLIQWFHKFDKIDMLFIDT